MPTATSVLLLTGALRQSLMGTGQERRGVPDDRCGDLRQFALCSQVQARSEIGSVHLKVHDARITRHRARTRTTKQRSHRSVLAQNIGGELPDARRFGSDADRFDQHVPNPPPLRMINNTKRHLG